MTSPSLPFDEHGIDLPADIVADLAAYPPHRGSVRAEGEATIIGNDGMRTLMEGLVDLVGADGVRTSVRIIAEGSSTGMPALLTGSTLLAPLSRVPWPEDLAAYRAVHGEEPVMIRIGHSGHGPRRTGKTPPAAYVHDENPLRSLTLEQVRRIAARGHAGGTILRWSQLGVDAAPWANRRIHLYGLPAHGGSAGNFAATVLGGLQHVEHYEEVADRRELADALAHDRCGIAISGWSPAWRFTDRIRPLALAGDDGGDPVLPGFREVYAERYPLTAPLLLCLARGEDGRIDPLALELCRAALSREGQELVAAQGATEEGYVPLNPRSRARQAEVLASLR